MVVSWRWTSAWFVVLLLAAVGSGRADPDLPIIPSRTTNVVVNFQAKGDGSTDNAGSINNAITAINTAGGGTVEIPANGTLSTYLCGPLTMKSTVNLQVDAGAMLKMLPKSMWTGTTTFVNGASLTDVEITGTGTIDGQYSTWGGVDPRPHFIEFGHSKRVAIRDVTLQNPPKFTVYVKDSDGNLTVSNLTIATPSTTHNTDGMDISSTNMLIKDCHISDGDDNLEIGGSALAANIIVNHCTFGTGHGMSLGSTISGMVTNLLVTNCTWNATEYGIHMKSDYGSGSFAQGLTYLDSTMSNVNFAVAIYSYYGELGTPSSTINIDPAHAAAEAPPSSTNKAPIWSTITISDLDAFVIGGNIAGIIWGTPLFPATNITLNLVKFRDPTKTFCVYNARGIQIVDSNLSAPTTGTNTLTIYNAQITITNSVANTNLVTIGGLAAPPTNNVLALFNAMVAITDSNVLGAGSITLGGSTLALSQSNVTFSNTLNAVSASTLIVSNGTETLGGALIGPGPLSVTLTNSGALRFNQGANAWGGSNAIFSAGSSGTINNHAAGNVSIFLGALCGGSGSSLQGSDQSGAGVDTYTIGGLSSNTTFAGTIANGSVHAVALTKIGSGIFMLSGANTYSGGTTLSNGTLLINNTSGSGTGTGAVNVVVGATLGGGGVISGPVTVNGTLAPGNSPGTLTVSNNLVANGGATLQYQLGANSDLTVVSGNLTLSGTLNISNAGGFTNTTYALFTYGGTLTYNGVTVGTTPNPSFTYTVSTNTPGQVNLIVSTSCSVGPAGAITGSSSVNAGDSSVTYSISSVSGANNYTWTVPSGASIANGQGTTSITVNYSCAAVSGNVAVTPSNGSCSGAPSSLLVTVTGVGAAGSINGPSAVCAGQTGLGYSISSVSGATTYTWAVPSGATITGGQGSTSISVNWGSVAGNVMVTPSGANGCTGSGSSLSVAINAAPGIVSDPLPQATCDGGLASFTVSASGAGLSYQWQKNGVNILSDGGTIGGSATAMLTLTGVNTGDSGASFDCVVSGTCSPPATSGAATLTVNANPATFNVTGGGSSCAAGGGVTVGLDGSESTADYQLELNGNPTGAPVVGTGSAISFTNQTAAGTYTVVASNVTSGCTATMNGSVTVSLTDLFACWQLQYFGCTNCPQADASADPDGDGQNNMAEFLAGTDPTNSASALRITSTAAQGANVNITWNTAGGHTNIVQVTSGDGSGGYTTNNFLDIPNSQTILPGFGGDASTNYLDLGGATNVPSRYYRIRLVP